MIASAAPGQRTAGVARATIADLRGAQYTRRPLEGAMFYAEDAIDPAVLSLPR